MFKMEEILDMMKTFNNLSILEIEVEKDGLKINMRKLEPPYVSPHHYMQMQQPTFVMDSNIPAAQPLIEQQNKQEIVTALPLKVEKLKASEIVKSTVVGAFTLQKGIEVGKPVKKGELIAKVESLSIAHEIVSPVDGEVAEILVDDNQLIEYGEELFKINV